MHKETAILSCSSDKYYNYTSFIIRLWRKLQFLHKRKQETESVFDQMRVFHLI